MKLFLSVEGAVDSKQQLQVISTTMSTAPPNQLYHRIDLDPAAAAAAHVLPLLPRPPPFPGNQIHEVLSWQVRIGPPGDPLEGQLITRNCSTFRIKRQAFVTPSLFSSSSSETASSVSALNAWLQNPSNGRCAIACVLPSLLFRTHSASGISQPECQLILCQTLASSSSFFLGPQVAPFALTPLFQLQLDGWRYWAICPGRFDRDCCAFARVGSRSHRRGSFARRNSSAEGLCMLEKYQCHFILAVSGLCEMKSLQMCWSCIPDKCWATSRWMIDFWAPEITTTTTF